MSANEGRVGSHLLLEGWGAPHAVLDDPLRIRTALQAAVAAGELTLLRMVLERFEPQGITGIALLAESHVAVHTWPERELFAADLFHCGTLPAVDVARELAARLDAPSWRCRVVERIVPGAEPAAPAPTTWRGHAADLTPAEATPRNGSGAA